MSNETVEIVFVTPDSKEISVQAPIGLSILEVAHMNNLDLEGACEGSLACATCHVVLEESLYNSLDDATEEEEDMLDLAFGLTSTSRLGCQIIVSKALEGTKIKIPSSTRNISF
ncbi:MAG: ferredoxin family 2Fe-2S iron-sulfur cluster binding protein [Rickettsia sp.]|nr:ferredoxin family 2Fe-2S iron-sulfur cluster binding protein [Rickettsia sp.]